MCEHFAGDISSAVAVPSPKPVGSNRFNQRCFRGSRTAAAERRPFAQQVRPTSQPPAQTPSSMVMALCMPRHHLPTEAHSFSSCFISYAWCMLDFYDHLSVKPTACNEVHKAVRPNVYTQWAIAPALGLSAAATELNLKF